MHGNIVNTRSKLSFEPSTNVSYKFTFFIKTYNIIKSTNKGNIKLDKLFIFTPSC